MKLQRLSSSIICGVLLLLQACGSDDAPPTDPTAARVWQGGSANLELRVFASQTAGALSDPPAYEFNYPVMPTPQVAIENWLPSLMALPAQRALCVQEGSVFVLSVQQNNQVKHYMDENHAACVLTGVPADTQAIASQDMQTLQGLLSSYEQQQAQRVADAEARMETCRTTVPAFSQGIYGCFFTATDVIMPYVVNEDVRPDVGIAVFAASTPLDRPATPLAVATSNAVGHYAVALASGRYLFCTEGSQPSTGACETVDIVAGQLLRRSYVPGSPPEGI